MKTEIIKIKHVKPIQEKLKKKLTIKDYSKFDACVKIACLKICSENKIRESIDLI